MGGICDIWFVTLDSSPAVVGSVLRALQRRVDHENCLCI